MPRNKPPETPLYVRLPNDAVEKLHRAAEVLGMHKKDLVAKLVSKYIDPDNHQGLSDLSMSIHRKGSEPDDKGPMMGTYSFQAYEPPQIMNAEQAGLFLQIDERMVIELAEAGKLPGKRLGPDWRFSREALVAWLSVPERR